MRINTIHKKNFLSNIPSSSLSNVFKYSQIIKLSRAKKDSQLLKILSLSNSNSGKTIAQSFDSIYKHLFNTYRCEYIYKNEIVKQLLLARHQEGSAKLYNEVQVYNSIADVLIVNGTSTVYEIKTELDTLERLESQINSYKLVFDRIYIVTHSSIVKSVKQKISSDIGIIILDDTGVLKTIRKSASNKKNVEPVSIFNLLHKSEYLKIINEQFGFVPNVQPVYIYNECRKLFSSLEPEIAHDCMLSALKTRKTPKFKEELYKTLPESLKLLASNNRLTKKDITKIDFCLGEYF